MIQPEKFRQFVARRFMLDLLATPLGRAYVLTQASVAEGSDESAVFDRLLGKVDDPQLRKAIATHKADEDRHAAMFAECAKRQGLAPIEIPLDNQLLPLIAQEIGGFEGPIESDADVMRTYLVLQVIEERALEQFSAMVEVMEKYDPKSAAVVREIIKDEERHLKYCHAVSKRYATSEKELETTLAEYRQAEARAFAKQQKVTTTLLLGMETMPKVKRFGWQAILAAIEPLTDKQLPLTSFARKAQQEKRSPAFA